MFNEIYTSTSIHKDVLINLSYFNPFRGIHPSTSVHSDLSIYHLEKKRGNEALIQWPVLVYI